MVSDYEAEAEERIANQRERGREHGERWANQQKHAFTRDDVFAASARFYPQESRDFIAAYNLSAGFEEGALAVLKERLDS